MHRESSPAKGLDVRRARGKPENDRTVVGRGEPESDRTVAGQGGEPAKGQVVR